MNTQNLQEEGKEHQVAAMPLAAGSTNRNLQEDPQVTDVPLAAAGLTNRNLQDEGSHQLSSVFDFNGNDIALDLPPEGSVVMVDSDIVPTST